MNKQHICGFSGGRLSGPVFAIQARMFVLFLVTLAMSGCASTRTPVTGMDSPDAINRPSNCKAEERMGIRIEGLRLSAAGNMLDFRYRVSDPVKAAPLFERKLRPYLLDEGSGAAFGVPESPKVGQLRTTRRNSDAQMGRDYHMLFANPGHLLQAGQKVSLVIGALKLENLLIE